MSDTSFSVTAYPSWSPPTFSPASIPMLPALSLSEDERALIKALQSRSQHDRTDMETANAYYMASQNLKNLEIAIPKDLADRLRTLVGWAQVAVDPFVDRLHVEGFRLPGQTTTDETLGRVWALNGLDSEESLAYTDALSMGRAWWLVGSNPDDKETPLVTVESPLNVFAQWDTSGRRITSLLQSYKDDGQQRAALMLPDRTVHIAENDRGEWEITGRDEHHFGYVSAVRMANRPRTDNRDGRSEIGPAHMSLIDSACRRLMGLEGSSELYSAPRLMIIGAAAEDFTSADGKARKAWDAYISKINMLENDADGNSPSVQQLAVYDPSVFTKVIEMYASQFAGLALALPQDLGLYTDGNPMSVEAVEAMEVRRNQRVRHTMHPTFGVALVQVQQMVQRFLHNGKLPDQYRRIEIDWAAPELVNFSANADAVVKLTQGTNPVLPAASDVVLKRLGMSEVERAQIRLDRGEQVQSSIVAALENAASSARQPQSPQQVTGGNPSGNA